MEIKRIIQKGDIWWRIIYQRLQLAIAPVYNRRDKKMLG
jgi:hypothetical protein